MMYRISMVLSAALVAVTIPTVFFGFIVCVLVALGLL